MVPVVTGHVDWSALDQLTDTFLLTHGPGRHTGQPPAPASALSASHQPGPGPLSPATRDRLRRALLGLAADALSGPGGLAARLRAALDGKPLTTLSLPLDIGAATETIPAHLRRAVTTRHPCCAFPGCDQPATVCDIHHLTPRSRGGPTSLPNLVPLCSFHHLHRHPPMGLDPHPAPRRHHHRHQPQPHPHPPQPQPTQPAPTRTDHPATTTRPRPTQPRLTQPRRVERRPPGCQQHG